MHNEDRRQGTTRCPTTRQAATAPRRAGRRARSGPSLSITNRTVPVAPSAARAEPAAAGRSGATVEIQAMANKMLIDAAHPEETRVVVLRGNRVEEFDFESASRKQLRGNIYLAKVTRVEPSLQAAFVDYGGNRHGFLAFSEIHPDYYQIPVADRQALIEAEEREIAEAEATGPTTRARGRSDGRTGDDRSTAVGEAAAAARPRLRSVERGAAGREGGRDGRGNAPSHARCRPSRSRRRRQCTEHRPTARRSEQRAETPDVGENSRGEQRAAPSRQRGERASDGRDGGPSRVGHAEVERRASNRSAPRTRWRSCPSAEAAAAPQYKIQEVIKRRQVLLVQVVKEERGNKGAALTTYLSLAGRYSVLMPNTARGGGISRKITSPADRKRLKEVASDLEVPEGMGVILRTAGASRTKAEVKRDFEYLLRLWENVRELTLRSTAPTLVYEEGSLIKRSIRDLYNKDIDEIPGRRRRRLSRGQGLHAHAHAEPCQERPALPRQAAALRAHRHRGAARRHVLAAGDAPLRRLPRHQPDRGAGLDRRQLRPFDPRAQHRGHRPPDQSRGVRGGRPGGR